MPSDTEILDWLSAQGVDVISLINGGGIDVRNSNKSLREAIAEAIKEEAK